MFGLVVMEGMTLSGHLSNIDEIKSKWRLYGSNFMKLNYMADRSNIRELIIKMEACTAARTTDT
jgi:hypothetical protein